MSLTLGLVGVRAQWSLSGRLVLTVFIGVSDGGISKGERLMAKFVSSSDFSDCLKSDEIQALEIKHMNPR